MDIKDKLLNLSWSEIAIYSKPWCLEVPGMTDLLTPALELTWISPVTFKPVFELSNQFLPASKQPAFLPASFFITVG